MAAEGSGKDGVLLRALVRPLKLPLLVLGGLMGVLAAGWCIHGAAALWFWPDGVAGLRRVLEFEVGAAAEIAGCQQWGQGLAVEWANQLYRMVFRWSGLEAMAWQMASAQPLSIPDSVLRDFWHANRETVELCMLSTQLIGVRMVSMLRMLPLVSLLCAIALVDGLAARAIRRISAGRESAGAYHRAKHLLVGLIGALVCLGLLWPGRIDWQVAGLVTAGVLALLVRMQASHYKKHG